MSVISTHVRKILCVEGQPLILKDASLTFQVSCSTVDELLVVYGSLSFVSMWSGQMTFSSHPNREFTRIKLTDCTVMECLLNLSDYLIFVQNHGVMVLDTFNELRSLNKPCHGTMGYKARNLNLKTLDATGDSSIAIN